MPHWLRVFAEHQPVTQVVNALRAAILGQPDGSSSWQALLWSWAILTVFFLVSVALYQRRTSQ